MSDRTQFAKDRKPNSKWIENKMEIMGAFYREVHRRSASGKA